MGSVDSPIRLNRLWVKKDFISVNLRANGILHSRGIFNQIVTNHFCIVILVTVITVSMTKASIKKETDEAVTVELTDEEISTSSNLFQGGEVKKVLNTVVKKDD